MEGSKTTLTSISCYLIDVCVCVFLVNNNLPVLTEAVVTVINNWHGSDFFSLQSLQNTSDHPFYGSDERFVLNIQHSHCMFYILSGWGSLREWSPKALLMSTMGVFLGLFSPQPSSSKLLKTVAGAGLYVAPRGKLEGTAMLTQVGDADRLPIKSRVSIWSFKVSARISSGV